MAWTYAPICVTDKDRVRLLISDTDEDNPLFEDEEIDLFLAMSTQSVARAAGMAARTLGAKFSKSATKQVGDLRIGYLDRARSYIDLARTLDSQADRSITSPFAGGTSITERDAAADDSDRVDPLFRRGLFQDPQSVQSDLNTVEDEECGD